MCLFVPGARHGVDVWYPGASVHGSEGLAHVVDVVALEESVVRLDSAGPELGEFVPGKATGRVQVQVRYREGARVAKPVRNARRSQTYAPGVRMDGLLADAELELST